MVVTDQQRAREIAEDRHDGARWRLTRGAIDADALAASIAAALAAVREEGQRELENSRTNYTLLSDDYKQLGLDVDALRAERDRLREALVRADGFLSLLWHRHVPPDRKPIDLAYNVEQTIGTLRALTRDDAAGEKR